MCVWEYVYMKVWVYEAMNVWVYRVLYRGGDPGISPLTYSPLKFDNYMYTKHQYIYEYSFTFYI